MRSVDWPRELDREIRRIVGPEDPPDERVNGDPDSTFGDDDVDDADEDEDEGDGDE